MYSFWGQRVLTIARSGRACRAALYLQGAVKRRHLSPEKAKPRKEFIDVGDIWKRAHRLPLILRDVMSGRRHWIPPSIVGRCIALTKVKEARSGTGQG